MDDSPAQRIRASEHFLLRFGHSPWNALYRGSAGFLLALLFSRWSPDRSVTSFGLWFAGFLLILRVVPAFLRRVIPFSGELQAIWSARRTVGKQYDSYQWRKLLWIGIGMVVESVLMGDPGSPQLSFAIASVVSGGIGSAMWHKRRKTDRCLMGRLQSLA